MERIESGITSQGRISIPARIRQKLGPTPGSTIEWCGRGDEVIVRRATKHTSQDIHDGVEHDDSFDDVATPPFTRSRLPATCGARPERSVKNSRPSLHTGAEPPAFSASSARNASSSPTSSGQP